MISCPQDFSVWSFILPSRIPVFAFNLVFQKALFRFEVMWIVLETRNLIVVVYIALLKYINQQILYMICIELVTLVTLVAKTYKR